MVATTETTMNFQDAVEYLKMGVPIVLHDRPGGRLTIRSPQKALKKMGEADFLSNKWVPVKTIPWKPRWWAKECDFCDAKQGAYCTGPRGRVLRWPHVERAVLSAREKSDYLESLGKVPLSLGRGVHGRLSPLDRLEKAVENERGLVLRPSEAKALWDQIGIAITDTESSPSAAKANR
jgi:hypothetical protein